MCRGMRRLTVILMSLILSVLPVIAGQAGGGEAHHGEDDGKVDVAEMIFGHIGDSYGWHITEWNGRHIEIPLPCIVRSSTGWHVFMSSKIGHGHEYAGLFIAQEGRYEDKIVEMGPDGEP